MSVHSISEIVEDLDHNRKTKTAEELAAMIVADLNQVVGCPKLGVNVTVYGIPWNAMLMFGTAAGSVPNKAALLEFFEIIKARLQRLYDVSVLDTRD